MVYAVAVLLVSALTSVGLLAIWAATSRLFWFWRTMLFLGALAPLLLIPAYEPFVSFVIQGAVVVLGVRVVPWTGTQKYDKPMNVSSYSLRDILAMIAPLSLISVVALRSPKLNQEAWQSVIGIGLGAGLTSLIGWWTATRKATNWWVRCIVAAAFCAMIAFALARIDWFIVCFESFEEWPPDKSGADWGIFGTCGAPSLVNIWYFIFAVHVLFTNYLLQEQPFVRAVIARRNHPKRGILRAIVFTFVLVVALGPGLVVGFRLLNRYPIPHDTPPEPNGFDDFLAARELMPKVRLVDSDPFNPWEASEAELRQASDELAAALEKVDEGLRKPTWVSVDYLDPKRPEELLDDFRSLRWGLCAQGRLAECEGNYDAAARRYLSIIAFAGARSRGCLVAHDYEFGPQADMGFHLLYQCIDKLPLQKIPQYIEKLRVLDLQYEPMENYIHRSNVHAQRSRGWYGHLMDMFGPTFLPEFFDYDTYIGDRTVSSIISRLMQVELARRAYKAERKEWPEQLSELVPDYLRAVPIDPCSLESDIFHYRRDGERFILYSVGHNREDDHGEKSWQSLSYAMHGDIWLEDWYDREEEDESPKTTPADASP